jgi:adenylate kinase
MTQGKLVPDELVNQIVAARLLGPDTVDGYILDGFPRTLAQAQWLDAHLAETGSPAPIIAVEIQVEEPQLLRRITGRRTCPKCNRIYNIYFNPPKVDGLCDDDATQLCQRADDTEEAFHKRMEEYRAKTLPVIPHYKAAGRFRTVNGDAPVDAVAVDILCALKDLRRVSSDCHASETGVR